MKLTIGAIVEVREHQEAPWLGVIKAMQDGGAIEVAPAVMHKGVAHTDWHNSYESFPAFLTLINGVKSIEGGVKSWDENARIKTKEHPIERDGIIVDYHNVTIDGYLSTFEEITPADRDGDYVKSYAFDTTIRRFENNPVMLMDHINDIEHLAGSFTSLSKDGNGLRIKGMVSNAPELRKIRFLIAEGHLKTLSMGGLFLYGMDGKAIEEVELWEGSLTPIPCNPDARFVVRALDARVSAKALKRHMVKHGELRGV